VCFSLVLPASSIGEYRARHANLWPELIEAIGEQGGSNYSIFALPDVDRVVGYLEVEDLERWNSGGESEITRLWWKHMAEIMPSNPDSSPIACPIAEVFHLD
jgi:L-rhamnose mutarotase